MSSIPATRLLIATGDAAVDADELPPVVRFLIEGAAERLVITPPLEDRLHWLVSDSDRATHRADERLRAVLGHLRSIDAPSEGIIGDDSPMRALEDAVSEFGPDHILLALRSKDHEGWQERHLTDRVVRQFHIPITVFEIDRTGHVPVPSNPSRPPAS
jgi:hypothetical protein